MLWDLAVTFAASFALLTLAAIAPKLIAPAQKASGRPAGTRQRASGMEADYAAAVRKYLSACRDLAELLADLPDPREFKRRLDASLELYDQLPRQPAAPRIDPNGTLRLMLAEIRMRFAAGQVFVARQDATSCQALANEQQRRIARVESLLRAKRR